MSVARHADDRRQVAHGVLRRVLPVMLPTITEFFAAALAGAKVGEPDWSDLEWRIARAVVVIHGISPLLSRRLSWSGPPGWRTFLESQRTHTASRYRRMATLLANIGGQAAKANIVFVPLKGEALHAMEVYEAGDRPMADIDLLVKQQDLVPMGRLLAGLGYRPALVTADEHVLVPLNQPPQVHLGEHADSGITIELHATIRRPMPVRLVDITAQLWPSAPRPGRNDYPSLAALMGHLLMHAAVNMQVRILRMIQLHDMALLAPRLSTTDWSALLAPGYGRAPPWWAAPPLQLMKRYYPDAIPRGAIEAVNAGCSALLKYTAPRLRLSDVSVSNPHRPVFPALSWAGSFPEAFSCIGKRLHRGAQALRGGTATQDTVDFQPWITRSYRRRVIDLLLGRPRTETQMMVAAALDHDQSP